MYQSFGHNKTNPGARIILYVNFKKYGTRQDFYYVREVYVRQE